MDILLSNRDLPPKGTKARLVDGSNLIAQNIVEKLFTPIGSLPWNLQAGSTFLDFLNGNFTPSEVINELERVAVSMPSVIASTVLGSYDPVTDSYGLRFTGPGGAVFITVSPSILAPSTPVTAPTDVNLVLVAPGEYWLVRPGEAAYV